MKLISQGAEARIHKKENAIIKERFSKKYRHHIIDAFLRKTRTRRESRILKKLEELGIAAPKAGETDEERGTIEMNFVNGKVVKEIFEKSYKKLSAEIGKIVAKLHSHDIIHGDLTTSNMIYDGKLHLIDFGLGFTSARAEDKAVDLHLLDRALESKHHKVYPECMKLILTSYIKHAKDSAIIIKRYEEVQKRGRNKEKY